MMTETTDPPVQPEWRAPQLLDRVTPDAVLLLPPGADYDDPAVRAVRRKGIHGSDVAAIVGASSRSNPRAVWHEKHDGVHVEHPELAEAAELGREHEPTVARVWARRRGLPLERLVDIGTVVNVDDPWMRAQVDRLVLDCPDVPSRIAAELVDLVEPVCALEIKCRSAFVASRWRDDIPDDVLAQVAWQRIVTGLDHVHVACMIDGNRIVDFRYDRDVDLERLLVTECAALWDRVLAHDPPDMQYDAVIKQLLEQLFPDRAGERELDADTFARLAGAWTLYVEARETAAELKAAASAKILEALGDAEVLTWSGKTMWSYRQVQAHTVPEHHKAAYRALRGPRS